MAASLPPLPRELRSRFRGESLLGEGSFGVILAVHDLELERTLALKLIRPGRTLEPEAAARFVREGRILAGLTHPHLLRVFRAGEDDGQPWLLTELLEGRSLEEPPPPKEPLAFVLAIADALDALHAAGVLHRDIKPANVFLTDTGRPVLLDLGLAQDSDQPQLTATGALVGTPAFLAPEYYRGELASPSGDWFALGVTLYQLLEGKLPFTSSQLAGLAAGSSFTPSFHSIAPGSDVHRIALSLLATAPKERASSAATLRNCLKTKPGFEAPMAPHTATIRTKALSKDSSELLAPTPSPGSSWKSLCLLGCIGIAAGIYLAPAPPRPADPTPPAPLLRGPRPVSVPVALREAAARFSLFDPRRPGYNGTAEEKFRRSQALVDAAVLSRWKRYLNELKTWLIEIDFQVQSETEFEALVGKREHLQEVENLLFLLPRQMIRDLDQTVEAAYTQALFPYGDFGAFGQSAPLLKEHRSSLVNTRTQIVKAAEAWYDGLPLRLRERRLLTIARWSWAAPQSTPSKQDQVRIMADRFLPNLKGLPFEALALCAAIECLRDLDGLTAIPCVERAALTKLIAAHFVDAQRREVALLPTTELYLAYTHHRFNEVCSPLKLPLPPRAKRR